MKKKFVTLSLSLAFIFFLSADFSVVAADNMNDIVIVHKGNGDGDGDKKCNHKKKNCKNDTKECCEKAKEAKKGCCAGEKAGACHKDKKDES